VTTPQKPHDLGNGLVCASFGPAGEWLSLGTVHPDSGFVELNGLPLFDPEWRGNAAAVLRYRSWMRREEHAFLHVEAGRARISTRQDAPRGTRGVVQRLVVKAPQRDRPAGIRLRLNGRLGWPVLPEISEVDPPTEEGSTSRLKTREGTLRINGEGGPIIVQAWLRHGGASPQGSAEGRADMRIGWKVLRRQMPTAVAWVEWPEDADDVHIDIACTFDQPALESPEWLDSARLSPPSPADGREESRPLLVPARLVKRLGRMNQRAASYTRTCTALQVNASERCIVSDHRILPLSWTRDAYWQARLLLATWGRGGHDEDERIVADHLRWLFLRCERPAGFWARSHYPDGRRKDRPFQADQQLYPLLELADYATTTGRLPALPDGSTWSALVEETWEIVLAAIDPDIGLIRTEENAADEVPTHPFLVSDQVLLWHVAKRLEAVAPALEIHPSRFAEVAVAVRAQATDRFVVEGPLGDQWAYSIDGHGGIERYMDASDLPVALAALWGFCKPSDTAWRGTLAYAFDPQNPGFVEGSSGGLGSRHTPGTWTLGDIMGWAAFGSMGDQAAADTALERLVAAAFDDGMLPEAYDPEGSGSVVRHWFAWPGAALGALILDHAVRDAGE
jgi:hypothetical protein